MIGVLRSQSADPVSAGTGLLFSQVQTGREPKYQHNTREACTGTVTEGMSPVQPSNTALSHTPLPISKPFQTQTVFLILPLSTNPFASFTRGNQPPQTCNTNRPAGANYLFSSVFNVLGNMKNTPATACPNEREGPRTALQALCQGRARQPPEKTCYFPLSITSHELPYVTSPSGRILLPTR